MQDTIRKSLGSYNEVKRIHFKQTDHIGHRFGQYVVAKNSKLTSKSRELLLIGN